MPFLRVIRDKRGYETTYLMHWYREGSRQRSRILYVFRTPGGTRVGRTALDPEVLRQIEREYPDIVFDWHAVRENQQVIEPAVEQPRRRRPKREGTDAAPPDEPVPPSAPPPASPPPVEAPRVPAIPSALQGATADEQMAFLNEWYPIVREQIPRRTSDPVRREALLALAERLNPAAWTGADEIASGLQQAAEALDRIAKVFARRRRRPRRRSSDPPAADSAPSSSEP